MTADAMQKFARACDGASRATRRFTADWARFYWDVLTDEERAEWQAIAFPNQERA